MAKSTMGNGGKYYVEIAARVNPSPMEMPDRPLGLSPEQQSTSLRDLCDSVFSLGFPLGFPIRVSRRDKSLLEGSRSGENSKFNLA